jgi:hypothetical protein
LQQEISPVCFLEQRQGRQQGEEFPAAALIK